MRRAATLLTSAACLALAGPATAADQTVNATGSATWSPSTVTINEGEKVTWKNQSGFHNVVFDDGSYTQPSEPSFSMWSVDRVFPTAGTYKYHCGFHGTAMAGTVVVQGAGTPPPTGGGADGPRPMRRHRDRRPAPGDSTAPTDG